MKTKRKSLYHANVSGTPCKQRTETDQPGEILNVVEIVLAKN